MSTSIEHPYVRNEEACLKELGASSVAGALPWSVAENLRLSWTLGHAYPGALGYLQGCSAADCFSLVFCVKCPLEASKLALWDKFESLVLAEEGSW